MCTPDVAVPCPCGAWQGCAMPPHLRTIGSSRARTLVLPCVLTPHLPPCAIAHLTPTHFPSSPYSLSITLPTHIPSLSRRTFHPFVVSTPAISNSSHVSFHGVVLKRFRSHHHVNWPCRARNWAFYARQSLTELHNYPHVAPQVSQCHVHAVPGSDVPCPTPSPRCHAPAPGFPFLKFLTIISISPSVSSKSTFPSKKFCYL